MASIPGTWPAAARCARCSISGAVTRGGGGVNNVNIGGLLWHKPPFSAASLSPMFLFLPSSSSSFASYGGDKANVDPDMTRELLLPGPAHDMRVAVLNGDAGEMKKRMQNREEIRGAASVKYYGSKKDHGQNEVRRLESSVKTGGVDLVYVVQRHADHIGLNKIRAACKKYDVRCVWFHAHEGSVGNEEQQT